MTHDKREIARASGNRKFVICHNLSFLLGHLENTLSAVRTRRSAGVSPALSTVYISRCRLEAGAPGRPRHLTDNIFMRLGAPRRMPDYLENAERNNERLRVRFGVQALSLL